MLLKPFFVLMIVSSKWERGELRFGIRAAVTSEEYSLDGAIEISQLPRGDNWSVHKFSGICVGTSDGIRNVDNVIIQDRS